MTVAQRTALEQALDASQDDELTRVLADYLAEVEEGRAVDPEEWIDNHPAIADRLRTCLKGLHMVEEFACSIGAGAPKLEAGADGPTLGDFRIVRALGRGGMGVVYEAVERSLDRRVALKVLPFGAAIDPRRLARFRVESQAAAGLHHPHIIPVYSVGSEAGVHYYAMQLIDGTTLAQIIAELRHLKDGTTDPAAPASTPDTSSILSTISSGSAAFLREAARLGRQAALALEHAHENGVLHRDVKPSNLMIDGTSHLWVADFGLARFQSDSSLTASGDILGTLRYMSPEQALANRGLVDHRTDVYSLGATLYELITLHPPFEGSNRQDLLRKIAQDEPRRPRALRSDIPLDLETIVLKAVAKDPASRYSSALELALDLERFVDDQPIRARRPRLLERLTRQARKHMAIVMAVVPLLLLIVAGLSLGIVMVLAEQSQILKQQGEIRRQKTEAEKSQAVARRQRDFARRAVDEMYTLVARDWLSKQTNLQPLQRDLLSKALRYYQEFAAEKDADPTIRIAAAWAFYRMGDIERRLGRLDEGERGYRQAIEALETLGAGKTMGPDLLEPLAGCYAGLGELLDETGRADESTKALEHAVALRTALIEATPNTPANTRSLATRYEQLGTSLSRNGQYKEAEAAYQKALALGKTSDQPAEFDQPRSSITFALTLQKQGKLAEAQRHFRQAVEQYEALAKREPGVPHIREYLAESLVNLGDGLSKDSNEVEPLLRRAFEVYQTLASDAPEVSEYRRSMAATLLNLTHHFFGESRLREADATAREALVLLETLSDESPTVVRNQELLVRSVTWLAKIEGQAGQTETALADANRGRDLYDKLDPVAPDLRWDRAWNLANVARLQELSGNLSEADNAWRQSVGHFEVLVKEAPGRLDFASDLAYQLLQLGMSSARHGRSAEAERELRRSVDILQRLLAGASERSADRHRLAQAECQLGHFLFLFERFGESERFSRMAFHEYERLFFENYHQDVIIRACADSMSNIAALQLRRGRLADAVNSYSESLKLFDSLPAQLALDPGIRETRGSVLDNIGKYMMMCGRMKDAEPRIRQALKIRETLDADIPNEPRYQDALGLSKIHLGEILANRGEAAGARRLFEQGIELERKACKGNPRQREAKNHLRGSRKTLAEFLLNAGDYAESAAVADDMLRDADPTDRSDVLMEVAMNLAECALLAAHDEKLSVPAREAAALPYAERALDSFREATKNEKTTAPTINLAWFLLVGPLAQLRDSGEAFRLAREVSAKAPERADSWTILGAACYHCGDDQAALSAFQIARDLDSAKFGFWDFYVAMAQCRLGRKQEARARFEAATAWMKANPATKMHKRIRAHALSVLSLFDPAPPSPIDDHSQVQAK